ncbi:hypothetical protein [Agromyces larvae]|uniref:Helix-turn-helix domain-containing protein n=1 Tax=Agromyces larvae TaxID=2929802 RepID=A0ABY4BWX8_9MICO|nr:hypothetical protein [Agromyces larvae]UOE43733.1 hypothetical protein MTO99_16415 [Agromyces larvae]
MTIDSDGELIRDRLWFEDGFVTVPNSWARDPMITHQARGLLLQITSHKPGFQVSIRALVSGAINGRDAIQAQLNELIRAGYIVREERRVHGMKRYRYRLCDPHAPVDNSGQASFDLDTMADENPRSAPRPGFQDTENPDTENQILKTRTLKKNYLKNTSTGSVPEVTTEQPVDNSPESAGVQGDAEAQSATPSDALPAEWACPRRRGTQPHVWLESGYCRDCGTRVPEVVHA